MENKRYGTINFIPQEIFRKLQLMANVVTKRAYEEGLLTSKEEFTGRTLAYEILRQVTPNDCEHTRFRKFNSSLYTCKGCFGLFRLKEGVYAGPINILDLYKELRELHRLKKEAETLEEDARSEIRKKIDATDAEYLASKKSLIGAETHG